MIIQDYLRNGGTIQELQDKYGIHVNPHPEYPNLVLFKYDQIDSPMGEPLVQECRGLILDTADNYRVISHPFDKFFNESEGHAAGDLDLIGGDYIIQEKVDGSLCVLYHYAGKWHVQTSGSPDAGGQVHAESGLTFKKLFWDTWAAYDKYTDFDHLAELNPDYNYIFELTSQYNRIVVWHTEPKLTLIGVRNRFTQIEVPVGWLSGVFDTVKEFRLLTLAKIVESFRDMNPMEQEGYVVRGNMAKPNGSFPRVKVKHPTYIELHHTKDGLGSTKSFVRIIQTGEASEVASYFPQMAPSIAKISEAYRNLIFDLERLYSQIEHLESQKTFAEAATKSCLPAALFCVRNKKNKDIRDYVSSMDAGRLAEVLLAYGIERT